MEHFGFSWSDYEATPASVIHRMVERLNEQTKERSTDGLGLPPNLERRLG